MSGVFAAEKYAECEARGEARPVCECHGMEMLWNGDSRNSTGGYWVCAERAREKSRKYREKNPEKCREASRKYRENNLEKERARKQRSDAKKIRIRAGGIQFYLGQARTVEDAQRIRELIRREAPNGA